MYEASQLLGAQVMEVRTRYGLSRDAFSELAGFTGKSSARLNNIEKKDSWKPGDREAIATVLNGLENGTLGIPTTTTRTPKKKVAKSTKSTGVALKPIVIDTVTLRDGSLISIDQLRITPLDADGCLPLMPTVVSDSPELDLVDPVQEDDFLVLVSPHDPTAVPLVVTAPLTAGLPAHYARHHIFDVQPTPDVHAFSNSELQTWKKCRRKWWLAWYRRLQLQAQSFSDVRATGTRVHRALEAWYVPDGEPRVDPRTALERIVVEDWTTITELAAKRNVDDEHLSALAVEFTSATNLERAMIEGYVQWLAETGADADLRVIGSEQPMIVDTTTHVHGEERPIQLIGLLDTRVRRTTDDVRMFIDHKTVGDLSGPVHSLPQNEQMLHYHLLEWLSTEDTEDRCDGALYNMIRRVKRSQRAKPPFYARVEVRHNQYELDAYKRRMLAAAGDILVATERLDRGENHLDVVYPSPSGYCTWSCDFSTVCNMFDDGSRAEDMLTGLYQIGNPRARYEKKG